VITFFPGCQEQRDLADTASHTPPTSDDIPTTATSFTEMSPEVNTPYLIGNLQATVARTGLDNDIYSSAADMWSAGCIFAELLLQRPFLQGNQTVLNQLNTIFHVLGKPQDENWPDHKVTGSIKCSCYKTLPPSSSF